MLVGAYGGEILRDPRDKPYLGDYNSAYLYRPDGTRDPRRYDKIHLVLFGEYIPFKRQIPWLFEQLKMFLPKGWNPDYSLEHGTRYTIFEMAPKQSFKFEESKFQAATLRFQLPTSNFPLPTISASSSATRTRSPTSGGTSPSMRRAISASIGWSISATTAGSSSSTRSRPG